MNYIYFFILVTIIFIIYIELCVGNILFRTNMYGSKSINVSSMIYYLLNPLMYHELWDVRYLDINYIFIIIISSVFYFINL